ncbi:hypothetical protein [Haloarcula pelagica]|uniref:hypothetical protein n=1 Tax=Haloarcula pelagica TaxID=3033389 RepID=UPI0024C40E17|nr:hypothetical protein [Halomicroarcula sp. YJ-61-S]
MSPSRRELLAVLSSCAVGVLGGCAARSGERVEGKPSTARGDTPEPAATDGRPPEDWQRSTALTPPPRVRGGVVGHEVAVAGDGQTVLAGSVKGPNQPRPTPVTVFERAGRGWDRQAVLAVPTDSLARFGTAVALADDGTTAFVGAIGDGAPRVSVFERAGDGWDRTDTLAPDIGEGILGLTLDASAAGGTVLVGLGHTSGVRATDGPNRVLVYDHDGEDWQRAADLTPPGDGHHRTFGTDLAVSGNGTVALLNATPASGAVSGTPSSPAERAAQRGGAYVFAREGGTWDRRSVLLAPNGEGGASFGGTVALADDAGTALVGSPDTGSPPRIFERTSGGWYHRGSLPVADVASGRRVGTALALSADGRTALVGAAATDDSASSLPGAAYRFRRDGSRWRRTAVLGPWSAPGDRFGAAVALSEAGTTGVVGAPSLSGPGKPYVFE